MRLQESYRTLDLAEGASDEEVRRAHRDLTKVWHPDRFAHDPSLRARAEEKLKRINEAYETIDSSRSGDRDRGRRDPARSTHEQRQKSSYRRYVFMFSVLGIAVLFRRPTPGGLLVAAVCLVIVLAFLSAMRRAHR